MTGSLLNRMRKDGKVGNNPLKNLLPSKKEEKTPDYEKPDPKIHEIVDINFAKKEVNEIQYLK